MLKITANQFFNNFLFYQKSEIMQLFIFVILAILALSVAAADAEIRCQTTAKKHRIACK